MSRLWLASMVVASLLPLAPGPASAATTACDGFPDTDLPADAHIGDFGTSPFLGDVDGDGLRDVITGYWLGTEPDLGEHYLHVELASGWGTQLRIDTLPGSVHPMSGPQQVVEIAGWPVIVTAIERNANGAGFAFITLSHCELFAALEDGGAVPEIFNGGGLTHAEWFTCRDDGVEMIETVYGLDANQQPDHSVFVSGAGTFYRFVSVVIMSELGPVPLNLPRPASSVLAEFPRCPAYVGTFADDDGSLFQSAIEWMAIQRLTVGCNAPASTRYCPDEPVTRGEMAAFLVRAVGYTDTGGGDLFVDDDDSIFESAIDRLAAAGVTKGCNPPANDRFCPDREVTRAEMAAFMVRAFGYSDDGGGDHFIDDDGSVFETSIDKLFIAGITRGCDVSGDLFCPQEAVTRGQMAAFLKRAMG